MRYGEKTFTVGANSKDAAQKYRDNYDAIFKKQEDDVQEDDVMPADYQARLKRRIAAMEPFVEAEGEDPEPLI
jgi:hypothetical protein